MYQFAIPSDWLSALGNHKVVVMDGPEIKHVIVSIVSPARGVSLLFLILILITGGPGRVAVSGEIAPIVFEKSQLTVSGGGGEHVFRIEIARTPAARQRGLMERRFLAPDAGMLFLYDEPMKIRMWMKNTFIPLDMLFIDAAGVISSIRAHTTPLSTRTIVSSKLVPAVLELNAGTAERLGIKPGDRVLHEAFRP